MHSTHSTLMYTNTKAPSIMRRLIAKSIALFILLVFGAIPIMGQSDSELDSSRTLRVGVAGSEPFVFHDTDSGIALEIWERIARQKSWLYEYVPLNSVNEASAALNQSDVDLVVGPISITAHRLKSMQFSQPFYNSSISIMSEKNEFSLWDRIRPLFSYKLLLAVGVFLLILTVVGSLFWLAERKKSPDQFPHAPLGGIGTGMWLAIVTMSTTGYGDKAPITALGRIIAGTWMVICLLFATSMVAGIASTLSISIQASSITTIEQLSGKKTSTIANSPSEEFLRNTGTEVIGVESLVAAIDLLERKTVDAVVYDRPQLLYYLKKNRKKNLYISRAEYAKQGYGFAFPMDSRLVIDVNRVLLELSESSTTEGIIHDYIQKDE